MKFDERFITEEHAFEVCMKKSVEAYDAYRDIIGDRNVNIRYNNYLYDMPKNIANSIVENMSVRGSSVLKGHYVRDIVRNIADAVVFQKATECVEADVPMVISFDEQGTPTADAAVIFSEVMEGVKDVSEGFGETAEFTVDSKKVVYNEVGKQNVVLSPSGVTALPDATETKTEAKAQ